MSLETREWAWQVPDLLPSARLLLLALAEHVSEGTICFPGQSRLAAMCGVSDRQVRSLLGDLAARGLITVEHRPGQEADASPMSIAWRWATGSLLPLAPMTNRNPASGTRLPDARGQPEAPSKATGAPLPHARTGNRNSSSGMPLPTARRQPEVRRRATGNLRQATGTPLPPKRKRETEERN